MGLVTYSGRRLIPAPFVAFVKEEETTEDGRVLGPRFQITVRGKLVAWKGSPTSTGTWHTAPGYPADESIDHDSRLGAILRKQAALTTLFSDQGQTFEVQSDDGSQARTCNPRILRVAFPEGKWVEECDYEITMEADSVSGMDAPTGPKVSRASDEWNIETLDETKGTYRLTHSVSAVGKRFYDETGTLEKEPWEQAKDWVLEVATLGLRPARMEAAGVLDATSLQAFQYLRTNSLSETAGTFGVTESWICYDPNGEPPAVHEATVTVREAVNGRVTVSVDGNIQGLEQRDNTTRELVTARWTNALAKWTTYVKPNVHTVAELASGVTLNASALSKQEGHNELAGTLSYGQEFDNRPSPTIVGALSQSMSVRRDNAADVFAQVPVPGRAIGPVLQSIGTLTAKRKTVTLRVQMPAKTQSFSPTEPDTDALMVAQYPALTNVFVESDSPDWDEDTGQYNRSVTFAWV